MAPARGCENQIGQLRETSNRLSGSKETNMTVVTETIGPRLNFDKNCQSESQFGRNGGRATECIEEAKVRSPSSRRASEVERTRRNEDVDASKFCRTRQLDIVNQKTSCHMRSTYNLAHSELKNISAVSILLIVFVSQISSQQLLYFNSRNLNNNNGRQHQPQAASNRQLIVGPGDSPSSSDASRQATALAPWRSQAQRMLTSDSNNDSLDNYYKSAMATASNEARGALSRNLYSRVARNASLASSGSGSGSWHFPRISPEQAAEVLLTGAQVINKLAQVESPLNFCRTPDNQEGECSDIRKCIWLVLDKARLKQSVCLRNLIIPAVCCPISNANNTPIANMIQSTLEPVLFRPKGNGAGASPNKQKIAPSSASSSTTFQATAGGSKPNEISPLPSASQNSAFVIKNPSTTTTTTTSETTLHSTSSSPQPPVAASTTSGHLHESSLSSPVNQLFQESPNESGASKLNSQYVREKSSKYSWANETCGESARTRTGRILGGSDSKLGQWPWMTAMYLNKHRNAVGVGEFWCGGALINRRFILTAAHCLSDQRGNRYKNDQVTIKLGGVDLVRHQAPADILRNAIEPEPGQSHTSSSRSSSSLQADQFFATHLNTPHSARQQQNKRIALPISLGGSRHNHRNGHHLRSSEDDEEFSWASFITKALGFVGVGSGGSSSSSSPNGPSSSGLVSNGSTKALDSNQSKRLQLAAHAKKTYFKEYKVASIKQHPNFQRNGFYNDIGLIELKSDVDFDELISPVCLPTEHDLKRDLSGYMATVLGWGTLSYLGQGSKLLQQVAMPIWSNKECDAKYLQKINENFLCAGFLAGGKDACQGDSGGPLMVGDQSGRWTLHGVVSFGKQCGLPGFPGVYSRVTQYLDWIEENTRRLN